MKRYSTLRRTGFTRKSYDWRPSSTLKRSSRLRAGKKTRAWDRVRRILKLDSVANERTTCELRGHPEVLHECTYDNYLGYAHDAKRRKLTAEDLKRAILICNNAHNVIEFMPSEEMKRIVNDVWESRESAAA
jgi:hypothetical protein